MKIILTGAAGFIGYHVAQKLLQEGHDVTGIDNLNDYYDVNLKKDRLSLLQQNRGFSFYREDISNTPRMLEIFEKDQPRRVIHLAAQAGVRYSITNPHAYGTSNLTGFLNILEACRKLKVEHLVYASSSSVYGANTSKPFKVSDNVDHPVSLYAATKKANELMAHSYSHLYGLPCTGLRFFTVYGPWGRPDMAYFLFTKAILEGKPIKVFNRGNMKRDFTWIGDIVEGVTRVTAKLPQPDPNWNGNSPLPGTSYAPYRIYNIGNNKPVRLMEFINTLENILGKEAEKEFLPMQPGDVEETYADIDDLAADAGYRPNTPLKEGLEKFVAWYREYYGQ
jgi:UDP-glucuronate 4-epimerase